VSAGRAHARGGHVRGGHARGGGTGVRRWPRPAQPVGS
jgi:hypothetical protein